MPVRAAPQLQRMVVAWNELNRTCVTLATRAVAAAAVRIILEVQNTCMPSRGCHGGAEERRIAPESDPLRQLFGRTSGLPEHTLWLSLSRYQYKSY